MDQDSEVLKVEQELRQLELEELERQRESLLFRETRAKAHLHNRHSMENLADRMYPPYSYENQVDCRKSMPELVIQKSSTLDYGHSVPVSHNYYGYENVRDLKCSNYVNPGHLVDGMYKCVFWHLYMINILCHNIDKLFKTQVISEYQWTIENQCRISNIPRKSPAQNIKNPL